MLKNVPGILIQATLRTSVESFVESWISALEHQSSKSKKLDLGTIDAKVIVSINWFDVAMWLVLEWNGKRKVLILTLGSAEEQGTMI